jgi:hypothetical protein
VPRVIDSRAVSVGPTQNARREVRTGRTTARAVAIAVALLLVSLLVVNGSRAALEDVPSAAAGSFSAGSVQLTDDDRGRSLIEVEGLVPGDRAVECIAVTYEGDASSADVDLRASVGGELAPALGVLIEVGEGAGFGTCTGFEPDEQLFDGTLAGLGAAGSILAFVATDSPQTASFRMTFTMDVATEDTSGDASADFVWEAAPS